MITGMIRTIGPMAISLDCKIKWNRLYKKATELLVSSWRLPLTYHLMTLTRWSSVFALCRTVSAPLASACEPGSSRSSSNTGKLKPIIKIIFAPWIQWNILSTLKLGSRWIAEILFHLSGFGILAQCWHLAASWRTRYLSIELSFADCI